MPLRVLRNDLDADASQLSVDADSVYVMFDSGSVLRVCKASGDATPLRVTCTGGNVVGDASHAYVVDVGANRASCVDKSGEGAARVLIPELDLSGVGLLDQLHLYVTTPDAICRVPKGGGPVERVHRRDEVELLSVDEHSIYFVAGSFFGRRVRAFRLPKAGGAAREVDIGRALPGTVRFVGGSFHVLRESGVLERIDATTGARHEVRRLDLRDRPFLAMNRRYVYQGTVGRAPLAGGPLETMTVKDLVHDVVDDSGIHWLERIGDTVALEVWA